MRRILSAPRSFPAPGLVLALAGLVSWTVACESPAPTDQESATPVAEESAGEPAENADESQTAQRPELPEGPPIEGFAQLMPRGGIPALFDPQFVTVAESNLPGEAWVMGFEHQGQAYAYDLNILNHHEVVNHEIAGLPVAAVW